MADGPKAVKTSVTLPEDALEALRDIAGRRGVSMGDVLRQAIWTEKYIQDTTAQGDKILIKEGSTGAIKELVIRP